MTTKKKLTASERWLATQMKDPEFRKEFEQARLETDAVDSFIRALDDQREAIGMSKNELAQRVSANASSMRRLLSAGGNPKLSTVMDIAKEVGLVLKLEPAATPMSAPSRPQLKRIPSSTPPAVAAKTTSKAAAKSPPAKAAGARRHAATA